MKYNKTNPCGSCPFRNDIKPYLNYDRVIEICEASSFACHNTTIETHDEDEEMVVNENSQLCAGFMILHEKIQEPSQMMRIAERIGLYDHTKLNMDAPVYNSIEEMAEAQ